MSQGAPTFPPGNPLRAAWTLVSVSVLRDIGRCMSDFASSEVCSRSTSFFRDITWEDRVPAESRARNSFSCAIFFSRCALCASTRARIGVFAWRVSVLEP